MGDFWGEPGTISPDPGSKIRVAFNGVSFRYGPEQPLVLRNVSFSAEPGERIVLTGHSGAGKTTCIKTKYGIPAAHIQPGGKAVLHLQHVELLSGGPWSPLQNPSRIQHHQGDACRVL